VVVLITPGSQSTPDIVQRPEPACVEALVAQPSVEALDMAVLHRLARLQYPNDLRFTETALLHASLPRSYITRELQIQMVEISGGRSHPCGPAAISTGEVEH
jgi:hypothetical protein